MKINSTYDTLSHGDEWMIDNIMDKQLIATVAK